MARLRVKKARGAKVQKRSASEHTNKQGGGGGGGGGCRLPLLPVADQPSGGGPAQLEAAGGDLHTLNVCVSVVF